MATAKKKTETTTKHVGFELHLTKEEGDALAALLYKGMTGSHSGPRGLLSKVEAALIAEGANVYSHPVRGTAEIGTPRDPFGMAPRPFRI